MMKTDVLSKPTFQRQFSIISPSAAALGITTVMAAGAPDQRGKSKTHSRVVDLELPANDVADDLAPLLAAQWSIENNPDQAYQRMAAARQKRIEEDRLKVVQSLGEVEKLGTSLRGLERRRQ
jgi:hypothetical protein